MDVRYGVDLGSRRVKVAAEQDGGGYRFLGPFDTAAFYRFHVDPGG